MHATPLAGGLAEDPGFLQCTHACRAWEPAAAASFSKQRMPLESGIFLGIPCQYSGAFSLRRSEAEGSQTCAFMGWWDVGVLLESVWNEEQEQSQSLLRFAP